MMLSRRWMQCFVVLSLSLYIGVLPATAAGALEPLRGKTIRAVIGGSPGGSTDTVLRAFFDSMREVLPDTTIRIQNLRGGGGAKAIKELQDATGNLVTVASFNQSPLFAQAASLEALPYDLERVAWIGAIRKTPRVMGVRADLGVSTLNEMRNMERQPVIGSGDAFSSSTLSAYLLNAVLGLRMHVVTAIDDPEQDAMLISGDLDAKLGGLNELLPQFESGLLTPIVVFTSEGLPDALRSVPSVGDAALARVPAEVVSLFESLNSFNSFVAVSSATEPETIEALRAAFDLAAARAEFVASMEAHQIEINPTSGIELTTRLKELFDPSSKALDEFRALIDCGQQLSAATAVSCD